MTLRFTVNRFRPDNGIMARGCTLAIAVESPSADLLLKVSLSHLILPTHRASLLQTGRMLFSIAQVIAHHFNRCTRLTPLIYHSGVGSWENLEQP